MIAGLYLSLFMYSGEYSIEYVERERLYLIRLRAGFRNLLPPGQFPYPFWHDEAKWVPSGEGGASYLLFPPLPNSAVV